MKPYQDRNTLEELYTRRGMSLSEVAAQFGVNEKTISRNMRKLGVATREGYTGRRHSDETKARMMNTRRAIAGGWTLDRERLETLYTVQNLSVNAIAVLVGCTHATVANLIEAYGIPKRRRGAAVLGPKNGKWGKAPKHGKRDRYVRPDGSQLWLRSSYEVRVARCLDASNVEWEYESRRFTLTDCTYSPDFYLPGTDEYWEVKGWLGPDSRKRLGQFRRLYPDVKFKILFKLEIEELERVIAQRET